MSNSKITMKSRRAHNLYTSCVLLHGNKKLQDTENAAYMQFNLPPSITCPYASIDCKKFCYAKRAYRLYPTVKRSQDNALEFTKSEKFVDSVVYTIRSEMNSKKYAGKKILFRVHESGDFYSSQYLKQWILIISRFDKSDNVNFHFYTKSFKYFLELNSIEKLIVAGLIKDGVLTINLSIDNSTTEIQLNRISELKKLYPKINTYTATADINGIKKSDICKCVSCAICQKCNKSSGRDIYALIH